MKLTELLIRLLIVSLAVSARICFAEVITRPTGSAESSPFIEPTVKILTSCYKNGGHAVGFVGSTSGTLIRVMADKGIPVTLIDHIFVLRENVIVNPAIRNKLTAFVLTVSAHSELVKILKRLKQSIWWNHMAHFLILYSPSVSSNGCWRYQQILFVAWKYDMLNAKVMCFDRGIELIFSYNPYTKHVPDHWKLVESIATKRTGEIFSLLMRVYNDDEEICKELDWDKTKDLGGFKIDITSLRKVEKNRYTVQRISSDRFYDTVDNIKENICRVLNVTPNYRTAEESNNISVYEMKGMLANSFNLETAYAVATT